MNALGVIYFKEKKYKKAQNKVFTTGIRVNF